MPIFFEEYKEEIEKAYDDAMEILVKELNTTPKGDLGEIGNAIGIAIETIIQKYKNAPFGLAFDRFTFLTSLEHGFSLVDGTHDLPSEKYDPKRKQDFFVFSLNDKRRCKCF